MKKDVSSNGSHFLKPTGSMLAGDDRENDWLVIIELRELSNQRQSIYTRDSPWTKMERKGRSTKS